MKSRVDLKRAKCCVIKIGSAVLTNNGQGLNRSAINHWVAQISQLKARGIDVIIVSSGSVAEGMVRLGWSARPHALQELQAAASVGQMGLIQAYEQSFQAEGYKTAQVLLTHDDLANRTRYLNARATIKTLLDFSVVPIINENDVVANEELRVGDNDTLAAIIANLMSADLLMILTDQDGFFDSDPRVNSAAALLNEVGVDEEFLDQAASGGSGTLGRGGMQTKLTAARIASRSGTATIIAPGLRQNVILSLIDGQAIGTLLIPNEAPVSARKRWLTAHLDVKGRVVLDVGAAQAIKRSGVSLLPIGVVAVNGEFARGELVVCVNESSEELARGLVNYSSTDIDKIKQNNSSEIERLLGYVGESEVIHRDNLVLL
ncbi:MULTISPECIES: glutamate 5-kinase [Cycloclasticus]|jgi:glutamate 5-kinase|uniref:Glutamate 5-kinase n=1 Tax=Cycloclasticus zancles 78-ME TaxID=1198232 RepID=S5TYU5_9GAMM|nr:MULTISPECIES: glutamate 5-kinase [Cycloclasticus]AGS40355.1 Glutamate 5-kinase [Cycloclasticus zancles 78-ME]MDF1828609.1 glutamate 5-kinase [Cycloclasticus pugetii]|tara:strand:+ start:11071 stop:12195 length:1125 start_codon:yes stop_codon:yes gene_type:complete